MFKDNLHTGEDARNRLISGIRKVADAVGGTMGTGGANSVIEVIESPGHMVTNDGYTIAQSIRFADPIEEMGRKILMEAISRANKASGDGSSTTTVLTASILEEGIKHLKDASPMEIKRSLDACIPLIEESIKNQKREITIDEIGKVASISAEDESIGALIQEIYQKIGRDGIIHWDISKTPEDVYTIGKGLTVEGCGFASPYMCDVEDTGKILSFAKVKNPKILITKDKISNLADLNPILDVLFNDGVKELVIFTEDFDPLVLADMYITRAKSKFNVILAKMPVIWRDHWYTDLAKASGATVIDPLLGMTNKKATAEDLGTFGDITITKDQTFIDGIKDISEHITALEADGTDEMKIRASRLNTKTARLFIGAHSDSALSYKRLKVEDAISASWQALNGGIVAGGGVALHNVGKSFNPTESVGKSILNTALSAPILQIIKNAGIKEAYWEPFSNKGYDTRTKEVVDMFKAGITDPANIVLNAVRNAISVSASILTATTIVTYPVEKDPVFPNQPQ